MILFKHHSTFFKKIHFIAVLIILSTHITYAEAVTLKTEVYTGSDVQGMPTFGRFSFFDLPVVNNSGQIAFLASYYEENQGGYATDALWTKEEDGPITLLVEDDMEARAVSESTYFSYHKNYKITPQEPGRPSSALINDVGEIAFTYHLEDTKYPEEYLSSAWTISSDGDLHPVVYEGMPKPTGGVFEGISYVLKGMGSIARLFMNDSGQVAFITPSRQIWVENPQCNSTSALLELNGPPFNWDMEHHLSDDGSIGIFDVKNNEIWVCSTNGSSLLVSDNEIGPGMGENESLKSIRAAIFNDKGSVAFGGYTSKSTYLYVYTKFGGKRLVRKGGSGYPLFLLDDGRLVYGIPQSYVPYPCFKEVWLEDKLIVQKGSQAPGSTPEKQFSKIWVTGANNKGQVVFKASLSDGGAGVYAWDGSGSVVKVVQSGDEIEVAPGDMRGVSTINFNTSYTANSKKVLNDNGKLIFSVHYAIVSAQLEQAMVETHPCGLDSSLTAANYASSGYALGLVNTYTGETVLSPLADISLGGPLPLLFTRYYASGLTLDGENVLGNNWRHNFDIKLKKKKSTVDVDTSTGAVIRFGKAEETGDVWELIEPLRIPYRLIENDDEYILVDIQSNIRFIFTTEDCQSWRLSEIKDNNDNTLTLNYNEADLLLQVSDGLGRTLTLEYDERGHHIVKISDGTRKATFGYDTNSNLTSYTDPENKTTKYVYDESRVIACGLLTEIILPDGKTPITIDYDDDGKVQKLADADGHYYTFDYLTDKTSVSNPIDDSGIVNNQIFEHNSKSELISYTDENSKSIEYSYDDLGRLTTITDRMPTPGVTRYTYHTPSGNVESITLPAKTTTEYAYSTRDVDGINYYDLKTILYPDDTSDQFAYDDFGNLLSWTDQGKNEWSNTYNSRGQVLTTKNPASGITNYTYNDSDGTLSKIKDNSNNVTKLFYDNLRRLSTVQHDDGTRRTYTYNNRGDVLSVKNENSRTIQFIYDDNSNLKSTKDPLLNTTKYDYDAMNRLNKGTDPLEKYFKVKYDEQWRVREIIDRNKDKVSLGYDDRSRFTTLIDPNGHIWDTTYDEEDVITSTTDPLGLTTTFKSDEMGRITKVSDHLGNSIIAKYDNMGSVEELLNPLGKKVKINYEERGLITSFEFPEGIKALYERNELGLITKVTDPRGYDWLREYNPMGRMISTTDPLGKKTTYDYDVRNRISHVQYSNDDTVDISYDGVGNIIRLLYGGPIVTTAIASARTNEVNEVEKTFIRDEKGRFLRDRDENPTLTLEWDENDRITNSNGIEMAYDNSDRLKAIQYAFPLPPVSYEVNYIYQGDKLIKVTDWNGNETTFEYYEDDHLKRIIRPNNIVTTYEYYDSKDEKFEDILSGHEDVYIDEANRAVILTEAVDLTKIAGMELIFNKAGKIISNKPFGLMDSSKWLTLSSDAKDERDNIEHNAASHIVGINLKKLQRDDRGRLQQGRLYKDKTIKYSWDTASRVRGYDRFDEDGNYEKGVAFHYDVLNRRTDRSEYVGKDQFHEKYTWNYALGLPRILVTREENTVDGVKDVDYWYHIYTPNGLLLYTIRRIDDTEYYYHFDILGNTAYLSNKEGKAVTKYGYTVFGRYSYLNKNDKDGWDEEKIKSDYTNRFTYKGLYGWMNEEPFFVGGSIRPVYYTVSNYYDSYLYGYISESAINFVDAYQFNPYQMGRGSPSDLTRLMGGVQTLFGVWEVLGGVAAVPETWGASLIISAHGIDSIITGWRTVLRGRHQVSYTQSGLLPQVKCSLSELPPPELNQQEYLQTLGMILLAQPALGECKGPQYHLDFHLNLFVSTQN